jgi:hypothetical protein
MMGRCPFGGQTWLYLNWLRGLARLGHDVWYVEDDSVWPYDPTVDTVTADGAYAVRHIAECTKAIDLPDRWAFRLAGIDGACWGLSPRDLDELYRSCDALLNVVGATALREEHLRAPFRVYVETDPVTAELCLAMGDEKTRAILGAHHKFATYGENYGAPDCGVPLNGIEYTPTRQPVDLDLWPMAWNAQAPAFTTIGHYRQDGHDVLYNGEIYRWSKHHEWEKVLELPSRTSQRFDLALTGLGPDDRSRLERHGWHVGSAFEMSLDVLGRYPAFIRASRAEFTVAKDQNVRLRSGWFSERDACYLASGKPVVAQDTGFSGILPTGRGLFAFTTMEEAVAAVDEVNRDYPRQCEAAREIAAEWFEAGAVARRLLVDLGLG